MKNLKILKTNKAITLLLVMITILSLLFFIPLKNNKVFASTEDSSSTKTTVKNISSDEKFSIEKGSNNIYTGDQTGKTMSIVVTANNARLTKPKGTTESCTIDCTWAFCGRRTDNAVFYSADLKFTVYKYNGTQTTSKILDYVLSCDKNGNWTESVKYYFEDGKKLDIKAKGLLNNGTSPFIEKDLSYNLELLITAISQDDNYKVEFSYDYFYTKTNTGVGKPFAWHDHYYKKHITNNIKLSDETGTIYDIFSNNIRKKYTDDNLLIADYGTELANNLLELEKQYSSQNITVSFLVPIKTNLDKEIPFAYKKTVEITVSSLSGRISTNEVVKVLKEENYISEDYEQTLLKCFNSNVLIGDKLDETVDSQSHKTEYMFKYYDTYIVHLKSSSADIESFSLKLTSCSDYYSKFCMGSNSDYAILDTSFYYAVFNNILNLYGLSGYKIPDGINKDSILTPSDLYGYWGFALIPVGGGFDGLLSQFFDTRKNSNGLCIPYSSPCRLTGKSLLSLQNDFGYSWIERTVGNIVNNTTGLSANATYYMFYVSELSNDFVYVVSENGNLEQTDTSSLTGQAVEKTVKTSIKGFKKITSKFLSFFDNKVFLYIVFGVLGFAGVMIVLKLLFFKKDK